MPASHIDQTTNILIRADNFVHLFFIQKACLMWIADGIQPFLIFYEVFYVPCLCGQITVTPFEITVDGVLVYSLTHDIYGFKAHIIDCFDAFGTNLVFKLIKSMTDTSDQLSAIASRSPPTNSVGFEKNNVNTSFSEFECGADATKTSADNTNLCCYLAFCLREAAIIGQTSNVVRRWIIGRVC